MVDIKKYFYLFIFFFFPALFIFFCWIVAPHLPLAMVQDDQMDVDDDASALSVVKKKKNNNKRNKKSPHQQHQQHQHQPHSPQPQHHHQHHFEREESWKAKSYDSNLWEQHPHSPPPSNSPTPGGLKDELHGPTSFSQAPSFSHSYSTSSLSRYSSAPLQSGLSPRRSPSPPASPLPPPSLSPHYLPQVISAYIQLAVNISVLLLLLVTLGYIVWAIKKDIDMKVEVYVGEAMNEIEICRRNYEDNKCAPPHRVPAMESQCNAWAVCIERNPFSVGRAKLSAQTVSEAINGFVEPISLKTMLFMFLVVAGFVVLSNLGFWMTRNRPGTLDQMPSSIHLNPHLPPPPQEPLHQYPTHFGNSHPALQAHSQSLDHLSRRRTRPLS